ncbi:MAG: Rieske 2Fe-2S domain-containing protein [Chloroflexota bacterium]|nr:Rieske 2Fe-2S domain-containing protein [Chloroflexota bacterium]
MADEPENLEEYEAANDFVDSLLRGHRPAPPVGMPGDKAATLRMAALLNSVTARESVPSPAFAQRLAARLGGTADRVPSASWRPSRRGFLGGLAAALALLFGGAAGDRLALRLSQASPGPGWIPVASAAELTPGVVRRFAHAGVVGHVLNIGGKLWALSAVCTHQACLLNWQPAAQLFECPCHGAAFNPDGTQHPIPTYQRILPSLQRLPAMAANGQVFVHIPGDPPAPSSY